MATHGSRNAIGMVGLVVTVAVIVASLTVAVAWLLLPSPTITDHSTAASTTPPIVQHLAVPAYVDPVAAASSWEQLGSRRRPGRSGSSWPMWPTDRAPNPTRTGPP